MVTSVVCVGHGIAGACLERPDAHQQVVSGKVDVLDTWSSTFPAGWLPSSIPSFSLRCSSQIFSAWLALASF